ncbi:putative E3 ubiquitin-protein ligase RNF144A [Artemisia annua]|uniref:Putative E3 ubiquitin-protein ligase RNF144A n=1 Tax=Artemisia annua TaxID=35608 RepID=A0A2U1KWC6_ARTAN|nr:putative E3 ubiquitin-protein ligase RNF144A [Artemisia annua]
MGKAVPKSQLKSQYHYQDQVEQAIQEEEETITCEICVEQMRLNDIFKNGHKYTHQFCTNCMSRYIQAVSLVERVYCPNNECSELFLSECDDNPNRCERPSWDQPFCFQCKVARHNGYSCAEIQEMRGDNDVALRALCKAKKWQRCPKCRHVVEHISGYNHIMCMFVLLLLLYTNNEYDSL